jgi:hypothetical protein
MIKDLREGGLSVKIGIYMSLNFAAVVSNEAPKL